MLAATRTVPALYHILENRTCRKSQFWSSVVRNKQITFWIKHQILQFHLPSQQTFQGYVNFFFAAVKKKRCAQLIWGCLENLQLTTNASTHAS